MAIIVAIDGASRRNGKPDCVSVGTVFIRNTVSGSNQFINTVEPESTSQRGEINALLSALDRINKNGSRVSNLIMVSDSEYIYNTVTKQWYDNWANKGWVTAEGNAVKNQDQWEAATKLLGEIDAQDIELPMYHIKGHLVNITKAQGRKLIEKFDNCQELYAFAKDAATKLVIERGYDEELIKALDTFEKNHGFLPEDDVLVELIACNTVADVVAGYTIDNLEK
ncbi:Ribonuclease H [compost metagenome]